MARMILMLRGKYKCKVGKCASISITRVYFHIKQVLNNKKKFLGKLITNQHHAPALFINIFSFPIHK